MSSAHLPRPARPNEVRAAFELLFRHLGARERQFRAERAQELLVAGELDPNGVFVMPDLSGVLVCQPVPGAGALIWPPMQLKPDPAKDDLLITSASSWLRGQGIRVAQCMLEEQEIVLARPLLRHGFRHITRLIYLQHHLRLPAADLRARHQLQYTTYDPANPEVFHETLKATYEGSLDCPEVQGVRSIAEVIHGHKSQGLFDPARWWLAWHAGQPIGVLLVCSQAPGEWEIVYLGVVPAARGKGLGREFLRHCLTTARTEGVEVVQLCVDARNAPAITLYERAGFVAYDHREVFLAVW